jgi:cyclase
LIREDIISDQITLVSGSHPLGIDVASVIVTSSEAEAVVFDTLYYPSETTELLRRVQEKGLRLVALVNTHWHADHTIGNGMFDTPRIIAHHDCGSIMRKELPSQIQEKSGKSSTMKLPSETFEERKRLGLASLDLDLFHLEGHTPDSIVAHVGDSGVLIAGDTVMDLPFVAYGSSEKLIRSLKELQRGKRSDQILQGHGGLCTIEKLDENISYLESIQDVMGKEIASGRPADKAIELPIDRFVSKSLVRKLSPAYKQTIHIENLRRIYEELCEGQLS